MVVTSSVEVAPVMPVPPTAAKLLTEVPDVRAGVTVTTMGVKGFPEDTAVVLVQLT